VRLILSEHYSPEIARRLRAKGHDVAAVAERAELVGRSDDELFQRMALEERAIMTNNVKDFVPLAHRAAVEGRDYSGLLLTSDMSLLRRLDAIGRTVDAPHEFLSRHHDKDSCRNQVRWPGPPAHRGQTFSMRVSATVAIRSSMAEPSMVWGWTARRWTPRSA